MFNSFLYPYSLTYILVKLIVLVLAVLLWLMLTSAPVV